METDLLYVEGLSLSRGNFRLDNISFSVAKEEILSVIGRTGAGKSLLLETLAGFQPPACGTVMYCGTPVHQIPAERKNIGYLHQDYSLFPHMTVEQNIGYSLKLRRVPGRQRRLRVEEMAERMGISHLLRQYPGTLSGGSSSAPLLLEH